jgi:hypothetical protein
MKMDVERHLQIAEAALQDFGLISAEQRDALARVCAELRRLDCEIRGAETSDFFKGAIHEVVYQQELHAIDDARKDPQDWFWTLGYLAGKALRAQTDGDAAKFHHHAITCAALCANWHRHGLAKPGGKP